MQSIPRRDRPTLPDFCSMGVALRVLLIGNMGLVLAALATAQPMTWAAWLERIVIGAAVLEPVLITSLLLLCPLRRLSLRWGYWPGVALVLVTVMAIFIGFAAFADSLDGAVEWTGMTRNLLLVAASTGMFLYYFHLRSRAFSPAVSEARLMALQARIRPHFLFNSLNAVLSLMRAEPKRAERALEDLADLFRALLREERRLVRLSDEMALCRRYLEIEGLRLGERLVVEWAVDDSALEAGVPPLMLQPLVENAIHHGIEPQSEPGLVRIAVRALAQRVEIEIINPRTEGNTQPPGRSGNHMALDNVRERLALLFDVEARLETLVDAATHTVRITLPVTPVRDRERS